MKKILVFHVYADDIITDNKTYKVHQLCLKHYKNVFDKFIFYLVVNDINNSIIITDFTRWVTEICGNIPFDIKVRKNNSLCEAQTFKEEILEKRKEYKDSFVFFGHTKNATRLDKEINEIKRNDIELSENYTLIKWCIALYFYSLNFNDEVERMLLGNPRASEMFYGPILTQLKNPSVSPMLRMNKGNCHYQGTFYWINMNKFNNYIDRDIIKIPEIDDRFWTEMLPGVVCGRNLFGDGCSSHNDVAINDDFNLYKMNEWEWNYLIKILGNSDEYWEFYEKIKTML